MCIRDSLLGRAFAVNTIPLAVKAYHQATGEDWARGLLVEWVDHGMPGYNDRASGPKIHDLFPESLCYVHELTGQARYLEETLWHLHAFMLGYAPACWASTGTNEMLDGKLYGRVYRGLVMYLSTCAKAGLLKKAEDMLLGAQGS